MSFDILLVLIILGLSLVLFIFEILRADVVALLVTLALTLSGILTVEEAFSGFANPAVVTVWAIFIISGGLERSGAADLIAQHLLRWAGNSETRLLVILMVGAGIMSAFMNNIGAVAILMPAVISIGRKLSISPSRLLMPLAFAALLGGNLTLIGTPPNILAVSIMQTYGLEPFDFFDFFPTGLMVLGVGLAYMLTFGRYLIPDRIPPDDLAEVYKVREYLTELRVTPESQLVGQHLYETNLGSIFNLNVIAVRPVTGEVLSPLEEYKLTAFDVLLIEGKSRDIVHASEMYELLPIRSASPERWLEQTVLDSQGLHLAEIMLAPNSDLIDQTLAEIDFRNKYGLSVLAIRHNGVEQFDRLAHAPIQLGDTLLVQGEIQNFNQLLSDPDLIVLETPPEESQKVPFSQTMTSSGILLAVVVVASFGWLHVAAVMLAGALLMVITGVLDMDEAYQSIDWKAVFVIAGMLPLGVAMDKTGTARLIAEQLLGQTGGMGAVIVMSGLFILTSALTAVMSNAAAVVLIVPISIDIAFGLNLNPEPFVMSTVIAASSSFMLPISHQVNILIYGAGGYKFSDYARVGIWLNILLIFVVAFGVPLIWPF